MQTQPSVLLIHGLWMGPGVMRPLGLKLQKEGFVVHYFGYNSITEGSEQGITALRDTVKSIGATHIVGHSLGGLMALALLEQYPKLPVQRIVCLGSPLCGSAAARSIAMLPGGTRMLGQSRVILDKGFKRAMKAREIGMIAGDKPIGLGCLIGKIPRPHDGSVGLHETRLPGLTDHVVIHACHTGMNFSPEAALLTMRFLNHGSFSERSSDAQR